MQLKKADFKKALQGDDGWVVIESNKNYEVHWRGVVRNKLTKNNLRPGMGGNGYLTVSLKNNSESKTYYVHRLVAIAFLANPNNKPMVNHISGIKSNNHIANLEWVTKSENEKHAHKLGLKKTPFSPKPVLQLNSNGEVIAEYKSSTHAEEFGYSSGNISSCCNGKRNFHAGYKWRYKN